MKKASPLVLIASLFLSVFFVGIMLFVLLEVLKVGDYHAFPQIITFAGINLAIFALVIGGGKFLANAMGTAPYASVCGVTVIYTLIALVFILLGTMMSNDLVWELTDMFNNLMVIPNAIALFALTGMVVAMCKEGKLAKK